MKASELTLDIVRNAILPSGAMKDQEATMKWLVTPEELRQSRCRAAERIAALITSPNMPRRAEPLPVPVLTPVPPAPEAAVKEDLPGGAVREEPSSPTVASVDIKADGSVTVRPSSPPPAPAAVEPVSIPAPAPVPEVLDLNAEDALKMIRATFLAWKGGVHVCGNAFKRMHEVESIIARAGF